MTDTPTDRPHPSTPAHVAIIMDGNGRWARARGLPRHKGHAQGAKSVKSAVKSCLRHRVRYLTLFAFSSENWRRPQKEVALLMELLLSAINSEIRELADNGVRLRFIGDHGGIPANVRRAMGRAEARTATNDALALIIAVGYGGRWDITQAARRLCGQVKAGALSPDDITERMLGGALSAADAPAPDLFIRTGGERRVSNFLLWQLAYTELYFTDALWPDFNEAAFAAALDDYARRQRRYGMTPEQIDGREAANA